MTSPADLVRDDCARLAGYLPVLAGLTPQPDDAAFAAPGMTARPPAAPLPGNAQAIYALTSIWASARWAEALLLYAAGAGSREPRGGSDANTARLLTDVIPKLFALIEGDRDLERLIVSEFGARLAETESLAAIDVAQQWRPVRGRACPYCGCFFLRVLLDAAGRPAGHVECHAAVGCRDGNGLRPAAQATTDEHGRPVLMWADGLVETAPDPDLEG